MTDETNDLPDGGTDNVEISETDDLERIDYFDPDDERDDDAVDDADGTDDEEGEALEEGQEPEESDEPEEGGEPKAVEFADDALVSMPDGTTISFADLKESPMLKADHTRKTQALSNERAEVVQTAQNIEGITNTLVDFLASALPAEPPLALAASDPKKYTLQKATYDAATAQLQKLVETGRNASAVTAGLSEQDKQKAQQAENSALIQMFPDTADPAKRQKFLENATEAARAVGYSGDEVKGVYDSKTIALAHWAKIGMDSVKAREKAAAKVVKVPPVSPKKPSGAGSGRNGADAMRKLVKSGSIHDAVKIDFE